MDIYTVTFFGHRDFQEHHKYEKKLIKILTDLIRTKEYIEFLVGRNGEFDIFAASAVKQAQSIAGKHNSSLILVIPYHLKDEEYFEKYYDEVEICMESASSHFKAAIEIRNKKMIDNANLIIAYPVKSTGGTQAALQYAKKTDKQIINLCELKI